MSAVHEMLQKRRDLLLPTIARLQEELQGMDGRLLAVRAGAEWPEWQGSDIRLRLLGEEYAVAWPQATVRRVQDGSDARADV
ncbi:MAG: hypothetical protein E3J25_02685, partial [Anaerolineales bacterium]